MSDSMNEFIQDLYGPSFTDELYHFGVKGMKWDKDKKSKNDSPPGSVASDHYNIEIGKDAPGGKKISAIVKNGNLVKGPNMTNDESRMESARWEASARQKPAGKYGSPAAPNSKAAEGARKLAKKNKKGSDATMDIPLDKVVGKTQHKSQKSGDTFYTSSKKTVLLPKAAEVYARQQSGEGKQALKGAQKAKTANAVNKAKAAVSGAANSVASKFSKKKGGSDVSKAGAKAFQKAKGKQQYKVIKNDPNEITKTPIPRNLQKITNRMETLTRQQSGEGKEAMKGAQKVAKKKKK